MDLHALVLQDDPPADGGASGSGGGNFLIQFAPLILIFFLFWILLIRPQRRQQRERNAMLSALKKNDHVVTSGGVLGIVDRIKENEVILKVDEKNDVRIRVLRSAIVDIRKVSGASDEDKTAEAAEEAGKN